MNKPQDLKISYYELILTENCDLRCKYCFDDAFSDRSSCNYDTKMDITIIPDLANFIYETKNPDPNHEIIISYFGGEPLLNWEFIEAFTEYAKLNFKFNYRLTINTNGRTLNKEKIKYLTSNKVGISLSLDGIKKSHDINRLGIDNNGTYDSTVENLPYLIVNSRKNNNSLTILAVVTNNNIDYLYDNYKFLNELNVGINFQFESDIDKNDEYFEKLENTLRKLVIDEKLKLTSIISRAMNNKQDSYCFIPEKNVTIKPNGDLFYCHRLTPKMSDEKYNSIIYGNIYDGYLNMDYYNIIKNRVHYNPVNLPICSNCEALSWCNGGCLAIHYQHGKFDDINHINPIYCKINKIIEKIISDIRNDLKSHIII